VLTNIQTDRQTSDRRLGRQIHNRHDWQQYHPRYATLPE